MGLLLLLPLLIPFVTAALALLNWRRHRVQRALALVGSVGLLLSAFVLLVVVWRDGIQVVQLGNWPAPYGITFVADLFSAIMTVLGGIIAVAVVIFSHAIIYRQRERYGFYPLLLFL
jgi:multicomponent Na+:H+ antiporter subunit D